MKESYGWLVGAQRPSRMNLGSTALSSSFHQYNPHTPYYERTTEPPALGKFLQSL